MEARQIKANIIAEADDLLRRAWKWQPGPAKSIAVQVSSEIATWDRAASERPVEGLLRAKALAPECYREGLERLFELQMRIALEHGVERGIFERGAKPGTYARVSSESNNPI